MPRKTVIQARLCQANPPSTRATTTVPSRGTPEWFELSKEEIQNRIVPRIRDVPILLEHGLVDPISSVLSELYPKMPRSKIEQMAYDLQKKPLGKALSAYYDDQRNECIVTIELDETIQLGKEGLKNPALDALLKSVLSDVSLRHNRYTYEIDEISFTKRGARQNTHVTGIMQPYPRREPENKSTMIHPVSVNQSISPNTDLEFVTASFHFLTMNNYDMSSSSSAPPPPSSSTPSSSSSSSNMDVKMTDSSSSSTTAVADHQITAEMTQFGSLFQKALQDYRPGGDHSTSGRDQLETIFKGAAEKYMDAAQTIARNDGNNVLSRDKKNQIVRDMSYLTVAAPQLFTEWKKSSDEIAKLRTENNELKKERTGAPPLLDAETQRELVRAMLSRHYSEQGYQGDDLNNEMESVLNSSPDVLKYVLSNIRKKEHKYTSNPSSQSSQSTHTPIPWFQNIMGNQTPSYSRPGDVMASAAANSHASPPPNFGMNLHGFPMNEYYEKTISTMEKLLGGVPRG